MKKSIFLLLTLCLIGPAPVNSQSLFKKVAGSMKDELLGTKKANTDPEPACACSDAEVVVSLGGKLQIDYKEADISTMDDGSLLMKNRLDGKYFIVNGGTTIGPLSEGDPRLSGAAAIDYNKDPSETFMLRYKDYISKSGDKYIIKFLGKQYGPFAQINSFVVPKSKDKFAAIVVENIVITEADSKKMEEAMKNAKTDQEKMELSMQYAQQMQQKMLKGGGAEGMLPKLITNVSGPLVDATSLMSTKLDGNAKYDDIVILAYYSINDLAGKSLINLKPEHRAFEGLFLNTSNTKYAIFTYGTLTFSDGTSIGDLFNPHLVKTGSQVYLAYMYYSPKKNAIMQCKIPW
jgi:hypothetical protein